MASCKKLPSASICLRSRACDRSSGVIAASAAASASASAFAAAAAARLLRLVLAVEPTLWKERALLRRRVEARDAGVLPPPPLGEGVTGGSSVGGLRAPLALRVWRGPFGDAAVLMAMGLEGTPRLRCRATSGDRRPGSVLVGLRERSPGLCGRTARCCCCALASAAACFLRCLARNEAAAPRRSVARWSPTRCAMRTALFSKRSWGTERESDTNT